MRLTAVVILCVVVLVGCTKVEDGNLQQGIDLFLSNQLQEALPHLRSAVQSNPNSADAHAWLAECLRRMRNYDEAAYEARLALKIDDCHSFARTVLGNLYNPQYSEWENANSESSWLHLKKAIECDSSDGNAWISVWLQAIRRWDLALERSALIRLLETGFLTDAVLAYNRWQLQYLPRHAILLTNGDMDTYPSLALQEKDGFRNDVAVVNVNLLNLPWYVELVCRRHNIPLPFEPEEIRSLRAYRTEDGVLMTPAKQVIAQWIKMEEQGMLQRPLCAAVTVSDLTYTPETKGRLVLCGPYFEIKSKPAATNIDTARVRLAIENVSVDALSGSFTAPTDRSPIRRMTSDRMACNVPALMLRYVEALIAAERWEEARRMLDRAVEFDSRIIASGTLSSQIDSLRQKLQ